MTEQTKEIVISVLINAQIEAENSNKSGINDEFISRVNSALEELKNE